MNIIRETNANITKVFYIKLLETLKFLGIYLRLFSCYWPITCDRLHSDWLLELNPYICTLENYRSIITCTNIP
jgi:hypothetical protein